MTSVHYWKYHNGIDPINPGSQWPMIPHRGWTCWVYPKDDKKFLQWMAANCPNAECTWRFNSGDPMYTVSIKESSEATLFMLTWM